MKGNLPLQQQLNEKVETTIPKHKILDLVGICNWVANHPQHFSAEVVAKARLRGQELSDLLDPLFNPDNKRDL